ncbi:MAG: DUF4268 domain-containing protein [Lachnospiraceae bacterium]|nr:DUF4268 domain-containing protein [Lachnospiraceae bacterium]
MKGTETKLVKYMSGSDKRFVIPVYQRNYDWKMENCKQLYDDLVKLIKNSRPSHFFGSIVSVYDFEGINEEYLVIDGQQRLTTVSLLFLAMYNLLEQKILVSEDSQLSQKIYKGYLIDEWKPKDTRIKLKPVKNDSYAYGKLFDDKMEHVGESNLTINYNYFYARIQKEEVTIDELYSAICRLEIISITLNPDDNPQLIFESLNSTGLALSEGDKIRNFILMGLPAKKQEEYYEKYWNKIEVNTNYDVSLFIRDYLSVKQKAIPSLNKVYFTFKIYVDDNELKVELLLKELLDYSKLYKMLLDGKTSSRALNACIYRLNRLETTVTRPFFLDVLRLKESEEITMDDVVEIFVVIESFLFRRTICDLPTSSLNKIFLFLHREILRYDGTVSDYVAKMKYALLVKKEKARFPDDEEFLENFETKQIYFMNSKNKLYLLERLENQGTKEDKDVYRHFDSGDYSIEHIMPQHLSQTWKESLGTEYETIHDTWLHRIANLTITAYNSKYSNEVFTKKRDMENGFRDSGLRMNQVIGQEENWGLSELEKRNENLKKQALKIWSMPVTVFKPVEKQLDIYSLDDEVNLTGRMIAKFAFRDTEYIVVSWVEMYQKVLQILHEGDKSVLTRLAGIRDDSVDLSVHVSYDKTDFQSSVDIADGIYMWARTSTAYKISLLRRFFALYGVAEDELVFYLKNESDSDEEEISGTRFERRRKYWTFALEHIHAAHGNGSFSNVTTSKENWIFGFIGYGGVVLSCVANQDSARVEFYIATSDKEKNKKIFDYMYSFKNDIEEQLGINLTWNRCDDIKASRIFIENTGLGIINDVDWLQMAKYHAEWSKKFYDVFVPYMNKYMG